MGVRGEPHKTSRAHDRVNPLSHTPGGVTVRVIKWDGYTIDYPNVKYPKGFIKKVLEDKRNRAAFIKD
tara:strand:- start:1495 stop:1698 length:204 start_codon:yes stop_codon:yes gene_type:complete